MKFGTLKSMVTRRSGLSCLLGMVMLSTPLDIGAQAQKPDPQKVQKAEAEAPPAGQVAAAKKKQAGVRLARYEALGKRDPFQNLANLRIKPAAPRIISPPPLARRPPGLSGLLISEVSLIGRANKQDKKLVVLRGTDKFTYVAREGTKLYDGFIVSIEQGRVTFEREVRDTAGNRITSKVVKR